MPKFPYMGFPFPYYKNSPKLSQNFSNSTFPKSLEHTSYHTNECEPKIFPPCSDEGQKNKSNNNNDNFLFDLFGLKIYTDDVLLVSLIYFLYSEGVKDESLFIVLILLLLS